MRLRTTLLLACLGALLCASFAQSANAAAARPAIDIVEVSGVLDPPLTKYMEQSIADANRNGAYLIVIEIDSAGALDVSLKQLVSTVANSRAPVAVWVGPNNAQAASGAALVVAAGDVSGMAPGATLGPVHPA
ncbi:MAG: hypothetical protein LC750_05865, partial [Actinobacteria bacterium]|nr:hypothetical protein [Actinomycetota bacterium]